jgi:hypothetical protein
MVVVHIRNLRFGALRTCARHRIIGEGFGLANDQYRKEQRVDLNTLKAQRIREDIN